MQKIIELDGLRFVRDDKTGYYLSNKTLKGKRCRIHRYIWEKYNGEIPKGYHVHHKDLNKSNNDISNLELVLFKNHLSLHGRERVEKDVEWFDNFRELGIEAAKEWHKSKEGREWHKDHYEQCKDKFHKKEEYICLYCGNKFETQKGNNKFCANKCKSAYRRREGLDDEVRICANCNKKFYVNKYRPAKCCSKSCSNEFRKNNKGDKN
jgi:hypothetical protein